MAFDDHFSLKYTSALYSSFLFLIGHQVKVSSIQRAAKMAFITGPEERFTSIKDAGRKTTRHWSDNLCYCLTFLFYAKHTGELSATYIFMLWRHTSQSTISGFSCPQAERSVEKFLSYFIEQQTKITGNLMRAIYDNVDT